MKYEFDAINVGDVVKVKGTVVRKFSHCMEIKTGENTLQVIDATEISDLLPAPFKVGDKVRSRSDAGDPMSTIMGVDGEVIWIKLSSGGNVTVRAECFEIVPPSGLSARAVWLKSAA